MGNAPARAAAGVKSFARRMQQDQAIQRDWPNCRRRQGPMPDRQPRPRRQGPPRAAGAAQLGVFDRAICRRTRRASKTCSSAVRWAAVRSPGCSFGPRNLPTILDHFARYQRLLADNGYAASRPAMSEFVGPEATLPDRRSATARRVVPQSARMAFDACAPRRQVHLERPASDERPLLSTLRVRRASYGVDAVDRRPRDQQSIARDAAVAPPSLRCAATWPPPARRWSNAGGTPPPGGTLEIVDRARQAVAFNVHRATAAASCRARAVPSCHTASLAPRPSGRRPVPARISSREVTLVQAMAGL